MSLSDAAVFWLWTFGLGVVALVPIWLRGIAIRAGYATLGPIDVSLRNLACSLVTLGLGGLLWLGFKALSQSMALLPFLAIVAVWLFLLAIVAMRIDASERRHQR